MEAPGKLIEHRGDRRSSILCPGLTYTHVGICTVRERTRVQTSSQCVCVCVFCVKCVCVCVLREVKCVCVGGGLRMWTIL